MTIQRNKRYPNRVHHREGVRKEDDVISLNTVIHSILPPHTFPCKMTKLDQEQEEFFHREHRVACQLLGYLPVSDPVSITFTGPYIPAEERNRQLAEASDKKRLQMQKQWGLEDISSSKEKRRTKFELRSGRLVYRHLKSVRHDNPRSLAIAREAALSTHKDEDHDTGVASSVVKDKAKLRSELKERDELKKRREVIKKVKKRKDVLQKASDEKRERRAATIAAAVSELVKEPSSAVKEEDVVPSMPCDDVPLSSSPQFVFNIQEKPQPPTQKKKKATIEQLKQQLQDEQQKIKMLSALKGADKSSLADEMISTHNWMQATRKLHGQQPDNIQNLSRDLKRAELKQKNKGKKVKEVLERQKQDKHKKTIKRLQNLRTKRVGRLAKKMKRFAKKGHIVPGFM